jgi:alginate O-acetyltransferase complex protein AlgI
VLFDSWVYVWFLVLVWLAYLRLPHVGQNRLLCVAGLVFYGAWDWRFLGLLLATTGIDWACGLGIAASDAPRRRRLLLTLAIAANLTSLGFFKYCDFFAESLVAMGRWFGLELPLAPLGIVLPVGISFYTFQEISYLVDLARGQTRVCRSLRDYVVYVAYFPQLVAGPIERASHLVRQVVEPREVTWAKVRAGLWLLVSGYFLKVVVADNAARVADRAFDAGDGTGAQALLGVYAFALQIYGDFAGYSNIARGSAALMGFDLMVNFRQPYLATGPSDLWRRWHISLSTWLRDYLYIPLGGNRGGAWRTQRNLVLTMLLGGLWHGAHWKFVLWGLWHGVLLAFGRGRRDAVGGVAPVPVWRAVLLRPLQVVLMFHLTCYGWLLFRCNEIAQAVEFPRRMVVDWRWTEQADWDGTLLVILAVPVLLLDLAAEVSPRLAALVVAHGPAAVRAARLARALLRLVVGALMLVAIYELGVRQGAQFLYFQF